MNDKWVTMSTSPKAEESTETTSTPKTTAGRVAKLTKLAKVPSWTKDMSLETYSKQIAIWTDINEDVPEYVKYHDLIEDLKRNKDIKGIQKYVPDHILPVLIQKTDQTLEKVVQLLDKKYRRSQTEKFEEAVEDMSRFREDGYEEDDDLIRALRELNK